MKEVQPDKSVLNLATLEMRPEANPKEFSEKFISTGTHLYMFSPAQMEVKQYEMPKPKPGAVAQDNVMAFMFGMRAADAKQRYDYSKALQVGRFLDEEVRPDWFEEPLHCDDVEGHARLAERLETPIAVGETLFGRDEFRRYLDAGAAAVLQPDVTRLGGLTATLKVAALAEAHHKPLAPHVLPEVAVHLACGLPAVSSVEYMPWLYPLFRNPPAAFEKHGISATLESAPSANLRAAAEPR